MKIYINLDKLRKLELREDDLDDVYNISLLQEFLAEEYTTDDLLHVLRRHDSHVIRSIAAIWGLRFETYMFCVKSEFNARYSWKEINEKEN